VVADLAGAILDAQMQAAADHKAAADARSADDAKDVLRSSRRADARLGERKRVSVVDQTNRPPDGFLERRGDRAADPVAVQVGEEDPSAVAIEEARKGNADGVDLSGRPRERRHPRQDRRGTFLGSRGLRASLDDLAAVEYDELDVRAPEIESELPQRAVQPPSTVSTAPVTKGAVAR
jgi:hypothetical protein